MNRRLLFLLAIAAFAAPALILRAQQQPAPQPPGPPGILRGIVVRDGTAEPLRDVRITARTFSAVTDSDGRFTIEGLPAGQHPVTAQREGFFGTSPNGISPAVLPAMARGTATITSQQTTEIRLAMVPGAAVSGRVLGPNGMPVTNAGVLVLRPVYDNGVRTMQAGAQKQTDDRGDYRHFQLPPGDYYLATAPRQIGGSRGDANSTGQPIEVLTFYPNAIDAANALPFTLKPGDELTGMNLQLQAVTGSKISGRVVSLLPADATVPQAAATFVGNRGSGRGNVASITLLPRDRNALANRQLSAGISANLTNSNDGAFEIPNVPAGTYDLYAGLPFALGWGPPTQPMAYGRAAVEVRGRDVSGITISVHPGVDVPGQILVDGKPALAPVRMGLLPADSSSGIPQINLVGRGAIPIQQDGSFLIPLVPQASYRPQPTILTGAAITQQMTRLTPGARGQAVAPATPPPPTPQPLPASAYVADVRQGGASVYDDGITIGTRIVGPLEVLINTNGGTIQGTVVGAGQQPHTSGAAVVLVPPMNRRQNPALYRTAAPNPQGTFTIAAVPPGPYKLFAWESIPQSAYQNADFMKTYEGRGVSIMVQANTATSATVTVIPADRK